MTGGDLVYWFQDYLYDLNHWQDANVLWLLGRTLIICFVLMLVWRIVRDIYELFIRPIVRVFGRGWRRISPFQMLKKYRLRRQQEQAELKYQLAELERQQQERAERDQKALEEKEALDLIADSLKIKGE